MPNELLGWSAINEIGEARYWSDPDTPPKCPECNAEMEPPAKCCGWYVREVYETDLVSSYAEGGESASKKSNPEKKRKTRNLSRTKSPSRSSRRREARPKAKPPRSRKTSATGRASITGRSQVDGRKRSPTPGKQRRSETTSLPPSTTRRRSSSVRRSTSGRNR